jgi:hypothetical protein
MKLHHILIASLLALTAEAAEIANSQTEFSGNQGQNGWSFGYRNYTDTGNTNNYDPNTAVTLFSGGAGNPAAWDGISQMWTGALWDLAGSPPWTQLAANTCHPNGTNQAAPNNKEHWTVRRWQADELAAITPLRVSYTHRKANTSANGTTVYLVHNGTVVHLNTMNSTTAQTRIYYLNVTPGDKVDLCLGPLGTDGGRGDGSDSSEYSMVIDDTIPALPTQPDGTFFIAANAPDTDADGLADAWENFYTDPDSLTVMTGTGDLDNDGSTNLQEQNRSTNPNDSDTDDDGLLDGVETNTGTFVNATSTGTNPRVLDTDGDTIRDGLEVTGNGRGAPPTNPNLADSDGDTHRDADEITARSNPNSNTDTPLTFVVANSIPDFSGNQGQGGWTYGYRNYTDNGQTVNYDPSVYDAGTNPAGGFIRFAGGVGLGTWNDASINDNTQHWSGSQWDLSTANGPWTTVAAEAIHPNGTNSTTTVYPAHSAKEHWILRRYSANSEAVPPFTAPTPVALIYNTRRTAAGTGVTGAIYINGVMKDFVVMPGTNGATATRKYFAVLNPADVVDLVLTPVGVGGNRTDSSDGSAHWLRVDTRIPFDPFQPDGSFFIPPGAPDTDTDGLADMWEDYWFENNLAALSGTGDYDTDGSNDLAEMNNGTYPNDSDTDNDGLTDGGEVTAGTNPRLTDTDGDGRTDSEEVNGPVTSNPNDADSDDDGFNDGNEVTFNSSPTNNSDTPLTYVIADSQTEFSGVQGANNWNYGYRNFTADGGAASYDPGAHVIPFTGGSDTPDAWNGTTQQWNAATGWDLNTAGAAPWTIVGSGGGNQDTHPNSANQAAPNNFEHWTIRRWTNNELAEPAPVALIWNTRKIAAAGTGVTGGVYVNGVLTDAVAIAGTDTTGVTRRYFVNLSPGDKVDLVLTPVGPTGDRTDGSDGSYHWMRVDTRIPANPTQPDGTPFIPVTPRPFVAEFTSRTDTAVVLRWPSHPSYQYDIEASFDLDPDPSNWIQVIDSLPAEAAPAEFTSYTHNLTGPFAGKSRILYRVVRRRL